MFTYFPTLEYDAIGDGNTKLVTDLLRRVALRSKVKLNTVLYDMYDIKEGETPEIISQRFYGDQQYNWIILMVNDITARYNQWPMPQFEFVQYLKNKYTDANAIHHYYITQQSGNTDVRINIGTSNANHSGATAVTNYEYEEDLQNQLRRIRILPAVFAGRFIDEFRSLVTEEL